MNPPADGATSAHRTRTNRKAQTMAQESTSVRVTPEGDVLDAPSQPVPASTHVRLQGGAR